MACNVCKLSNYAVLKLLTSYMHTIVRFKNVNDISVGSTGVPEFVKLDDVRFSLTAVHHDFGDEVDYRSRWLFRLQLREYVALVVCFARRLSCNKSKTSAVTDQKHCNPAQFCYYQ